MKTFEYASQAISTVLRNKVLRSVELLGLSVPLTGACTVIKQMSLFSKHRAPNNHISSPWICDILR